MKKQTAEQYLDNEFAPTVKALVEIYAEKYHKEQLEAKIEQLKEKLQEMMFPSANGNRAQGWNDAVDEIAEYLTILKKGE